MKLIWTALILLLSVTIVMAQATCPILDDSLLIALENCENAEIGTVCYGSGNISAESDAEDSIFTSPSDSLFLSDVMLIETANNDDELALASIQLNREDVLLRLIAYGNSSLENTAPRSTINVYTLRGVNLRQSPSLDATVIGSLFQGRDYTAIARLADNTWIQVLLEDGRVGWASAQYFVTQEGFTELEVLSPNTPPYLPMQAFNLQTGDCSGLLIIAPELEDGSIIFGINGAQIQVSGIALIQTSDDSLSVISITGEQVVNAFGFEMPLAADEITTIPLSDSGTIVGIPSDAEIIATSLLDDETIDILLDDE